MPIDAHPDASPARRLCLPLAQLYRRASNARTPLERHLTAFYLWEAALKLLASSAVAGYAHGGAPRAELAERLQNLARPALGHWWEFVRLLVPALAEHSAAVVGPARELLSGRPRDDLPGAAGLDAVLHDALEQGRGGRAMVRLPELFDRLVLYRNKVLAHAAPGRLKDDFSERMAGAILAGVAEILLRFEVPAWRRLVYVGEVRQVGGSWRVERLSLAGESPARLDPMKIPRGDEGRVPDGGRVYLDGAADAGRTRLLPLHPLLLYDSEAEEVLFLNSRRGKRRVEYLSYTTGQPVERPDLGGEQVVLLANVLGEEVSSEKLMGWAARAEGEETPTEEPQPAAEESVGDFLLLSKLGEGGMGVVYRAWQAFLGRQVALKCLSHPNERARARFGREVRALGRVEHPHLVKVYTSGVVGQQWYYAMAVVEGATLAAVRDRLVERAGTATDVDPRTWQESVSTACEVTRRSEHWLQEESQRPALPSVPSESQALPPGSLADYPRQVVEWVREAAEAAHALHEAGIVHRDIKPANIMVRARDGQAVLVDLGLAQLEDLVEGKVTRTRDMVGTLRYASPEQILAVGRVDRRADVYGLGATLWELLTLRPLYGLTDETPPPEAMKRVQYSKPERVRQYNPRVPPDLEGVIMKCLEKNPAERYVTAGELSNDLGKWLRGEVVGAQAGLAIRRWSRLVLPRRPITVGGIAVVLVGLLWWALLSRTRNSSGPDLVLDHEDSGQVAVHPAAARNGSGHDPIFTRWPPVRTARLFKGSQKLARSVRSANFEVRSAAPRDVRLQVELKGSPVPDPADFQVEVAVNGEVRAVPARAWGDVTMVEPRPARFGAGSNTIGVRVEATAALGLEAITLSVWANVPQATLHVLTVGVSEYKPGNKVRDLRYAHKDALDLAAELAKQTMLYQKVDPRTLVNDKATRGAILSELRELVRGVKADHDAGNLPNLAVVALAGHGITDPDFSGGRFVFLPYDFDPARPPDETGLPASLLREYLQEIPCPVVLLLDTSAGGAMRLGERGPVSEVPEALHQLKDTARGVILLTACAANQRAREDAGWGGGHGALTWSLLQCMRAPRSGGSGTEVLYLDRVYAEINDLIERLYREKHLARPMIVTQTTEGLPLDSIPFAYVGHGP
jgi:serine/threonine protein kinase